jgi:hypothetical protein
MPAHVPPHIYAAPRGWNFRGPVRCYPGYFGTSWFYFGRHCWYSPTLGYCYVAPAYYGAITIVVEEVVYNPATGLEETCTMYYNAYWNAAYGSYGYTDMNGVYHLVNW